MSCFSSNFHLLILAFIDLAWNNIKVTAKSWFSNSGIHSGIHYFSFYYILYRRRQWQPTPVLLPGKSHGWRSLEGCSPWGRWGLDTTEGLHFHFSLSCIGEGNGNPLQCSCLENPRDGRTWWAAISRVAQSRRRLKWLSSIYYIDQLFFLLHLFVCFSLNSWIPSLFNELKSTTVFTYFDAQIVAGLTLRAPLSWILCPFDMYPSFFEHFPYLRWLFLIGHITILIKSCFCLQGTMGEMEIVWATSCVYHTCLLTIQELVAWIQADSLALFWQNNLEPTFQKEPWGLIISSRPFLTVILYHHPKWVLLGPRPCVAQFQGLSFLLGTMNDLPEQGLTNFL